MCLACMTYLLSQWYFSYLSWASEGLIASDLGNASEIKTFSPAFSCCFGGVSWIDRKSLPYDCSAFTWRYLWLLLILGLWSNNSLDDLWQEVYNTRGYANDWWHERYGEILKENNPLSWEKDLWKHMCACIYSCADTPAFLFLPRYCSTSR